MPKIFRSPLLTALVGGKSSSDSARITLTKGGSARVVEIAEGDKDDLVGEPKRDDGALNRKIDALVKGGYSISKFENVDFIVPTSKATKYGSLNTLYLFGPFAEEVTFVGCDLDGVREFGFASGFGKHPSRLNFSRCVFSDNFKTHTDMKEALEVTFDLCEFSGVHINVSSAEITFKRCLIRDKFSLGVIPREISKRDPNMPVLIDTTITGYLTFPIDSNRTITNRQLADLIEKLDAFIGQCEDDGCFFDRSCFETNTGNPNELHFDDFVIGEMGNKPMVRSTAIRDSSPNLKVVIGLIKDVEVLSRLNTDRAIKIEKFISVFIGTNPDGSMSMAKLAKNIEKIVIKFLGA